MQRGHTIRGADGGARKSKIPLILGFLIVFALSVGAGFYLIGPQVVDSNGNQSGQVAQTPGANTADTEPKSDVKLKVDISEEKPAPPATTPETAAKAEARTTEPVKEEQAESTTSTDTPAAKPDDTKPEATPTAAPPKPAPKPAPAAPAASTPAAKPAPSGLYRVQLGVFSEKTTALQVAEQAISRGHKVTVVPGMLNGKQAWRVQAGTFKERSNADKQVKQLNSDGVSADMVFSPGTED